MDCHHFDDGSCRSCTWLARPYDDQLTALQERCFDLIGPADQIAWEPVLRSAESGFRNKAKMVVTGTTAEPRLGILGEGGDGVDLQDCALHEAPIVAALPVLAEFVTRAALEPYDLATRRGELKVVIVTSSPTGALMVRFVTRSQEPVTRIRKHLGWLREALPDLVVASVNLQPDHKAVLEGETELLLTDDQALPMRVNDHLLWLRTQSFFQTNTAVAAALYREAVAWTEALDPATVWDLYSGVGGFALHLAAPGRVVLGVESSSEAVASARTSAAAAGVGAEFVAQDAGEFARSAGTAPELVVVNPPRRGIGPELATWLETSPVGAVLYSSCNPESLARDLAAMPSLTVRRARLFDMFPHTDHAEVLVLLERAPR